MEIIRQNSDDRCVAGRRVYTVMPVASGNESDYNAYTDPDPKYRKIVPFDDLVDAFRKGNLIVAELPEKNGVTDEWTAVGLRIVEDTRDGEHVQVAVVTYIAQPTLESLVNTDTNKAYCRLGMVVSDINPNYVYVAPEP